MPFPKRISLALAALMTAPVLYPALHACRTLDWATVPRVWVATTGAAPFIYTKF
jgi:ABC-type nitrate/sulfonate/bicarbonate transport system substrate-binding protein